MPLLAFSGLLAICRIPGLVGTSPQSLPSSSHNHLPLSKFPPFKKKYVCMYVCIWLHWLLVAASGI